ncbi:MAG TPA: hypothetical protein VGN57_22030 [Pirellulaceae bacterium]|jgi:hypothetical protein|nr:hypothetical protein [Pirellulaceae bacterium]
MREFSDTAPPAWTFGPGREGWNLRQATDEGYPLPEVWRIVPQGDDPQIVGPPTVWRADRAKRLRIVAACEGSDGHAQLFLQPFRQSSPLTTSFRLTAGADLKSYDIPLEAVDGYAGALQSLRIDPPAGCRRFHLKSVTLLEA